MRKSTDLIIQKTYRLPDKRRQASLLVCRWPNLQSDVCVCVCVCVCVGGVFPQSNKTNSTRYSAVLRIINENISRVLSCIVIGNASRGEPCDKREMNCGQSHMNDNKLRSGAAQSKAWICGRLIVGLRVRISSGIWMSATCECCVLSVVFETGRSLFQKSINECECVCVCVCVCRCVCRCVLSSTPVALCTYSE
jgi:hypothetical protein